MKRTKDLPSPLPATALFPPRIVRPLSGRSGDAIRSVGDPVKLTSATPPTEEHSVSADPTEMQLRLIRGGTKPGNDPGQTAEDTDPAKTAGDSGAGEASAREEVTVYLNAFALAFGLRKAGGGSTFETEAISGSDR